MNAVRTYAVAALMFLLLLQNIGTGEASTADDSAGPSNYVFFGRDRERIKEPSFLENKNIAGAQIKYTWRELEPQRDRYDLSPILEDLTFLEGHGKRLFIQLQDVSFSEDILVPEYLLTDPIFGGGVARKYDFEGDDDSAAIFDGWVARRWDPEVISRLIKLLDTLGRALDGRIEGLNLAESAIGFGETGRYHPAGFTYETYRDGLKAIMSGTRKAFPRSCVILYANFMPGEWLPWKDKGYLRAVYEHASQIGMGIGGPDLLPFRKGQQNHSLPLIAGRGPNVRAGLAVQDGNLEERDPSTGERVSVQTLYRFAKDRLHLDYIFWGTQEPYYSEEVLPFIRELGRDIPR